MSMNKCTLFVGDLTTTCTEADLEEVFSTVGPVRHVRIQRTQGKQQTSLGYGFVKMGTPVAASRAMVALDGFLLFGRKLRIRLAAYRIGNNNKMEEKVQPTNSLYVKFVGSVPGAITNEEKIRDIFSVCGNLEDVNIRKTSFEKRKKLQRGYGFLQFTDDLNGTLSAIEAINSLSCIIIDDISYTIEVSKEIQRHLLETGLIEKIKVPLSSLAGLVSTSQTNSNFFHDMTSNPYAMSSHQDSLEGQEQNNEEINDKALFNILADGSNSLGLVTSSKSPNSDYYDDSFLSSFGAHTSIESNLSSFNSDATSVHREGLLNSLENESKDSINAATMISPPQTKMQQYQQKQQQAYEQRQSSVNDLSSRLRQLTSKEVSLSNNGPDNTEELIKKQQQLIDQQQKQVSLLASLLAKQQSGDHTGGYGARENVQFQNQNQYGGVGSAYIPQIHVRQNVVAHGSGQVQNSIQGPSQVHVNRTYGGMNLNQPSVAPIINSKSYQNMNSHSYKQPLNMHGYTQVHPVSTLSNYGVYDRQNEANTNMNGRTPVSNIGDLTGKYRSMVINKIPAPAVRPSTCGNADNMY